MSIGRALANATFTRASFSGLIAGAEQQNCVEARARGTVSTAFRGYKWRYKFQLEKVKPSIHAACRALFDSDNRHQCFM